MFQFLAPFLAGITKAKIGSAIMGAAVSGVAGSLSARANGGSQQHTTITNSKSRTNFQQMADDAAAAGFNPLTALRMTGGAGNVTTTGNQTVSSPALSGRAIAARGLASGLNSIGNTISNYDPLIEQRKQLEVDLLEKQLSAYGQKSTETLPVGITRMGNTSLITPVLAQNGTIVPLADITGNDTIGDGFQVDGIPLVNNTVPFSAATNIEGTITGDEIKPLLFPRITQDGNIIHVPFEEPDLGEAIVGSAMYGFGGIYDFYKTYKPKITDLLSIDGQERIQRDLEAWRLSQ